MAGRKRIVWVVGTGLVAVAIMVAVAVWGTLSAGNRLSRGPGGVVHVGGSLVATATVTAQTGQLDWGDGHMAAILDLLVEEVHWVGDRVSARSKPPDVRPGQHLEVLAPPMYPYKVGKRYAATFNYLGVGSSPSPLDDYEWWLADGISEDGLVLTNDDDPQVVKELFARMDAVDGDVDPPGVFLAQLAAEWEEQLNASGLGLPPPPPGPLLRVMFLEAGLISEAEAATAGAPDLVDLPAEQRIFPSDPLDAPTLVSEFEEKLGLEMIPLEAMILHEGTVSGSPSLALWFPGVGRTAEFFVDSETGITIINSLVPRGLPFEIVGFSARRRLNRASNLEPDHRAHRSSGAPTRCSIPGNRRKRRHPSGEVDAGGPVLPAGSRHAIPARHRSDRGRIG
ncbi:MAG: hypothetical protein KatS3mg011_2183 [Acidimicrobiia bacterium]|nr:MAG: hypothetical protein KatS3mg011_2183 [Acidimicrobiia bacterium]